ncbi:peptidyl-prolyl cis-trans isomerase [Lentisalinibacter salinarum]|uniref:peptidyl-prolyl cis-trans isomerase n=1 Tax=Lentisalinibacter salinarum TaxID=2992239 RepID=UPI003863D4FA
MPTVSDPSDNPQDQPAADRRPRANSRGDRRNLTILAAGACAGIALAVYGLLATDAPRDLPADAAARVNDRLIGNTDFADALAALGSDSRDALDPADRDWILRRLVEEELLVQRALELDLGHTDRAARDALVDAMIRRITRDAAARPPSEDELRAWYADNRALFAGAPRLRVQARAAPDEAAARALRERLVSHGGGEPAGASAGEPVTGLPDALLPPAKLRDYLGPRVTAALSNAPTGEWLAPLPYAGRWIVARVAGRGEAAAPPYGEIRDRVEAAWRRAQMDTALARYLDELRTRADIETAETAQR